MRRIGSGYHVSPGQDRRSREEPQGRNIPFDPFIPAQTRTHSFTEHRRVIPGEREQAHRARTHEEIFGNTVHSEPRRVGVGERRSPPIVPFSDPFQRLMPTQIVVVERTQIPTYSISHLFPDQIILNNKMTWEINPSQLDTFRSWSLNDEVTVEHVDSAIGYSYRIFNASKNTAVYAKLL